MAARATAARIAANYFLRLADHLAAARCAKERAYGPAAQSVEALADHVETLRAAAAILKGQDPDTALILATPGGASAAAATALACAQEDDGQCDRLQERADLLRAAAALVARESSLRLVTQSPAAAAATAVRTAKRLERVRVALLPDTAVTADIDAAAEALNRRRLDAGADAAADAAAVIRHMGADATVSAAALLRRLDAVATDLRGA